MAAKRRAQLQPGGATHSEQRNARLPSKPTSQDSTEPDAQSEDRFGFELQLPSRKGLLRCAVVLFLVLTHVCAFMLGYYLMPERIPHVLTPRFTEEHTLARAVRRLGRQEAGFSLPEQAQAMLRFMVDQPGRKVYELHFTRGVKRFKLEANLDSQVLSLSQTMPDGKGRVSRWNGTVLERLQHLAAGNEPELAENGEQEAQVEFFEKPTQQTPP